MNSLDNLHAKINVQSDHLQILCGVSRSELMHPTTFTLEDQNWIIRLEQSHASIADSLKKLSSNVALLIASSHVAEWEKTWNTLSRYMERHQTEGEQQVRGSKGKEKGSSLLKKTGSKEKTHKVVLSD
ncbi:hypothetical protein L6452_14601 [Arctium lappa]|uniref:Uncharacterized protein n=1 Tax=Arctium lappa TaxID=4217 RepID=A0ACB9CLB7_ARCLA|nr:hypothetical protein L6452_14601 [Arctium lappa]